MDKNKCLIRYINSMIRQEAEALSSLCISNNEENMNYNEILSVYKRLSMFMKDYSKAVCVNEEDDVKENSDVTKVIFKKANYGKGENEILAFFPNGRANPGRIMCYAHIGQHSEADYEFFLKSCSKCSESEYEPLKKELEELFGYRLKIVNRCTSKDRREAWMINIRSGDDNKKSDKVQ